MAWRNWTLVATVGSASLLMGALTFQAMGYAPCAMCLWQRWPHYAAVVIGLLALLAAWRPLTWLGAAALGITAGLGVYHTGVERDWWDGPSSCTGTGALDTGSLLSVDGPRLVMCDQVAWSLFGISMASWNAIFSAILVLIWLKAARTR